MFEEITNYGCGAWTRSSDFQSRKFEFEFVYFIVVIFGMKHEYKVLNDHFKSVYSDLAAHLKWA